MSAALDMTVVVEDEASDVLVPKQGHVSVVRSGEVSSKSPDDLRGAPNLFVLSTVGALPRIAALVRAASRGDQLRAVFVRGDQSVSWLPVVLAESRLRAGRNIIVHWGPEIPGRVLRAWSLGAQDVLIADASLIGDDLLVRSCALETFRVPVASIGALSGLGAEELGSFEVSESGSYLHWPSADVHLGLDAIRRFADPDRAARASAERLAREEEFGAAVAHLRQSHGLRQRDIEGLSERQVRRIERGSDGIPRLSTLEKLASAHGMSRSDYLNAVALVLQKD